ncbi:hypothetical protein FHS96_004878 [Sphingomonas zeicaulis]|uniref:CC_3452 family protein n=1 Tax=Sphingomonas zeicaulis TaxID=1632740 RepID=UPI003D1C5F0E
MVRMMSWAVAACLITAAMPAWAGSTGEVHFADGVAVPEKVVVEERLWRCAERQCSGLGETRGVAMMRACKALARSVGTVASYKVGVAGLEADALKTCNAAAD